jgi:hypothetical protein
MDSICPKRSAEGAMSGTQQEESNHHIEQDQKARDMLSLKEMN